MSFFTNLDLTIVGGATTGTVSASAQPHGGQRHRTGARMDVIDALSGIEIRRDRLGGGRGLSPETDQALLERGTQRLQRLVDTLLIPNFTQAALEDPRVFGRWIFDPTAGSGHPGPSRHSTIVVRRRQATERRGQDRPVRRPGPAHCREPDRAHHRPDGDRRERHRDRRGGTHHPGRRAGVGGVALHQYCRRPSGHGRVVRRRDHRLADQVPGVDYVDTLTTPASDVTLTGNATLVTPGTITVNITGWSPP